MERLINISLILILIFVLFCGCVNNDKDQNYNHFYHAYKSSNYIFVIEADFVSETTFFCIYTSSKKKVFEERVYVAPLIDSVRDKYIFSEKRITVSEGNKNLPGNISKSDTLDLKFEGYKLVTKYTGMNEGRGLDKKMKFLRLDSNAALFFDFDSKKDTLIPTSRIVSIFETLRIRNSDEYNDIIYSKDSSDSKQYFDAFFKK